MRDLGTVTLVAFATLVLTMISMTASGDTLNPTYDKAIEPNGFETIPIPGSAGFDVDVKITSDIAVDMYVMTQQQVTDYAMNKTFNGGYEDRFLDQTSKSFEYTGSGAGSDWVLIINDDPSQTANVHIEFKVLQEAGREAAEACCGGAMISGLALLIGVVAFLYAVRRP